jgi:SAM-dependent methyltransferase
MKSSLYNQLAQMVEDQHWWYRYRHRLICDYLNRYAFPDEARALDLGCGTGGELGLLNRYCREVYGLDVSDDALRIAKQKYPQYKFIKGDMNRLQELFIEGQFDIVTILNVLYHQWIESERDILRQVYHILKPGGTVLITEPAFKFLMRGMDVAGMGKTRYRIKDFDSLLSDIGFVQIRCTYFNSISFPPAFILAMIQKAKCFRRKEEIGVASELKIAGPGFNEIVLRLLNIERLIIKFAGRMPFGVTLLCTARKPGAQN